MSYWDKVILEWGHAAIHHNYFNDTYAHGKGTPNTDNESEDIMNYTNKRMHDLHQMRKNASIGLKETAVFKIGLGVEARLNVKHAAGVIPCGMKGTVTEMNDDSYTIDFDRIGGIVKLDKTVAEGSFVPFIKNDPIALMRANLSKTFNENLAIKIWDRVVDANDVQYVVEQGDVFGRRFRVLSEDGEVSIINSTDLKKVNEDTPLPVTPNQPQPSYGAGNLVRVIGVDLSLNQVRLRGMQSGVRENVVGQVGLLEFAYYQSGRGVTMYRVLLANSLRVDFGAHEIELA